MADIEELRRLLTIEYDALRKSIDKFDDLRYRVKALTVTADGALIALSVNSGNAEIAWVGVGATLLFFLVDLQYMMLQTLAIDGSENAEALLDSLRSFPTLDVADEYRFGLGKVFYSSFPWARMPNVLSDNFYVVVFYCCVLAGVILAAVLVG